MGEGRGEGHWILLCYQQQSHSFHPLHFRRWTKMSQAVQNLFRVVGHENQFAVLWTNKSFLLRVIQKLQQRLVKAGDVQQPKRLGMPAKLAPGEHFEKFLESSIAAGQGDETIRQLR